MTVPDGTYEIDEGLYYLDSLACGCTAFVVAEPAHLGMAVTCRTHGPTQVVQIRGHVGVQPAGKVHVQVLFPDP